MKLAGLAFAAAAVLSVPASASTITASTVPLIPLVGQPVLVNLSGISGPSQSTLTGNGYTISFSGVGSNQGVVQGSVAAVHAIPVANSGPQYLTGSLGSQMTTDPSQSGNYLSTGLGTITITFAQPQTFLELLWGSIDLQNTLSFNDSGNFTVTGQTVQNKVNDMAPNGFQGFGGSAYVQVQTDTPFTQVTATSSVVSFEFSGITAANAPILTPEPSGMILFSSGFGLIATSALLRRRRRGY